MDYGDVIYDQPNNDSFSDKTDQLQYKARGGSRTAATSKVERFVIIVNSFQPLYIITKCSILDIAAVLDPPLKACLAITGAIKGTSRECLYNDLRILSLSSRRWCRKLCAIHKLFSAQCPKYFFDLIPSSECFYGTLKKQRPFFNCRTDCFKYFY